MKQFTLPIACCVFVLCSFVVSVPTSPNFSVQTTYWAPADTLPRVKIPEGVDPNDENWKGIDLDPKEPLKPLSPADEAKQFLLPPGYRIEPVLTEPAIQQPGAIAFDGNGRMYVLELRSYMLTADSKDELEPTSRISRWEDKNNDGIYETGTTFGRQPDFSALRVALR